MAVNRGKDFEGVVKECMERVSGTYVLRLYDPQGGYAGVANPCDFVVYRHSDHKMFMIECKSVHGNTLSINSNDTKRKYGNISNTQWEGLGDAARNYIAAGVLCWWIDRDVTAYLPIEYLEKQKELGHKSISYNLTDDGPIIIKGTKKRIYFDYDFEDFFKNFI